MKLLIVLLALCPLEGLLVTTTHRARQRGFSRRRRPATQFSSSRPCTVHGSFLRFNAGGCYLGYAHRMEVVSDLASAPSSSSTSSSDTELTYIPSMTGVGYLEDWLRDQDPVATVDPFVEIAVFDNALRGIMWTGPFLEPRDEPRVVARIPGAKILRSQYPSPTWDSQLASQIWEEYQEGQESEFYPYVLFLASGQPYAKGSCPASVAPHAIRHWTEDQLAPLSRTAAGRRLLDLHVKQEAIWRQKYVALLAATEEEREPSRSRLRERMSWEQFRWAMEAVHSRAYVGASMEMGSPLSLAASMTPTFLAAIIVVLYSALIDSELPLFLLGGLALVAVLPLVSSFAGPAQQSAAMLPLIDAANHRPGADSDIRFDPISNSFELVVGPLRCVDASSRQLFVSYGDKSDTELLLNYGFVPDDDAKATPGSGQGSTEFIDLDDGGESFHGKGDGTNTNDEVRRMLAARFNARNG